MFCAAAMWQQRQSIITTIFFIIPVIVYQAEPVAGGVDMYTVGPTAPQYFISLHNLGGGFARGVYLKQPYAAYAVD